MPIEITMPALSPTMEEGKLAKWHVKEGDSVSSGDVIAEIETDKATMEVEAVDEGTIGKILVAEGTDNVKVNAVIAVLLQEGESADAIGAPKAAPAPKPEAKAEPVPQADAGATMRENTATQASAPAAAPSSGRCTRLEQGRQGLCLAAGPPSRQGSRHRCVGHLRLRPAWPRGQGRRRSRQIRQDAAQSCCIRAGC